MRLYDKGLACRGALVAAIALSLGPPAGAQDAQPKQEAPAQATEAKAPVTPERWAVHLQTTDILQYYPAFHSAFQGPNSFRPQATSG